MEPAPPPADTCLPLRHPEALHEDLQPVHRYHACESRGFLGRGYLEVGLVQTPAHGQVMRRQEALLPFFFFKTNQKTISLFLAVLGLHCCFTGLFSRYGEQGLLSSCSAWAPHWGGFSCF